MHEWTEKSKPEISSCCLQNVRTNSLVDSINTCLRHVHMSSVMWARLQSTANSKRLMFPLAQSIKIFMITKKIDNFIKISTCLICWYLPDTVIY